MNKLVHGVGINDSNSITSGCPFYNRWVEVLRRCYNKAHKDKHITYKECVIDPNWLNFLILKDGWRNKIGKINKLIKIY